MPMPPNHFKAALAQQRPLFGFWLALADASVAEICAGVGFDWLLIDAEHGPQTLPGIIDQLRAIEGCSSCAAVVRAPSSDPIALRQILDLGAATLMIPMVENAEQATRIVDACRYPPAGSRGIGGARASRWGAIPTFVSEANAQLCVIAQIETMAGIENLEAIAAVDGVDALFIGPADLAASAGLMGSSNRDRLRDLTLDALARIIATGKPAGILSRDLSLVDAHLSAGASFVAVGIDAFALADAAGRLLERFKP
ncbi:2-dehydro-3-deoxyglucarate aldolase [Sphingopyxis sp. HIX]|nr:2-dehydro-3-deoxyglucarate aldolase [Sphingopyxis sp. HIX]KTE85153.1 2-dehydro-3-deoxyglucarate aldolase [Sphingopyxis sp. HXXIV]